MTVMMSAEYGYLYLLAGKEAGNTLMRGFISVRDMAVPTFGLKRAIDTDPITCPRIWPSDAMISQTSGYGRLSAANTRFPVSELWPRGSWRNMAWVYLRLEFKHTHGTVEPTPLRSLARRISAEHVGALHALSRPTPRPRQPDRSTSSQNTPSLITMGRIEITYSMLGAR
jgi:hypothetical protein